MRTLGEMSSHAKPRACFCQAIVVAHVVGIARDIAVQALLKQALRRLLFVTESSACDKVRRSLQFAAQVDQVFSHAHILLNRTIAFGMGNNHLVTATLQVVDRVLVFLKVIRISTRRELKQKLV